MLKPIDFEYFNWLTSQIHIPNDKTYGELFSRLHNSEFIWFVPNDDNRLADGRDLRGEFLDTNKRRSKLNLEWVTTLEVLVALSRRVAWTAGGDADRWAWRLLKNLHLTKMSDPLSETKVDRLEEILYSLIWRTYQPNGAGGFFPLNFPKKDQTKLEIWDQMNAYIIEKQGL